MAWAYLGKRSKAFSGTSSLELERPTGAATGCLLVAGFYLNGSGSVKEANFTQFQNEVFNTNERWVTYWKIDDGSQKLKIVLNASESNEAVLMAFSGNHATEPLDTSSIRKTSAEKTMKTTSVTVAKANSLLLNIATDSVGQTYTPPSGMEEIVEHGNESTFGLHVAWVEVGAGATGEKNWSAGAANSTSSAVLAAFKPPAVTAAAGLRMII